VAVVAIVARDLLPGIRILTPSTPSTLGTRSSAWGDFSPMPRCKSRHCAPATYCCG